MAIQWGSWEYSGGNGMRVGIDVSWEYVGHGESNATATVKIYTENQYSYSDDQTLSYSGAIGGSTSFHNGAGGAQVLRDTKAYTYNYGSNEYGSSPGSRTFTAKLSGAFNGVTPSKSVTSSIPARPYDKPQDPTNVSVTRVSDSTHKITWTNNSTAGEPWDQVAVERKRGTTAWGRRTNAGGGSTSYSDTTWPNRRYEWRVQAKNSEGASSWIRTGQVWTTPDGPTDCTRTTSGSDQVLTWTNHVEYDEHLVEVWRADADTDTWTKLADLAAWTTTYTDVAPDPGTSWKYRVRTKTSDGVTLYSTYSNETSATQGLTSPPSAPSGLSPDGVTIVPNIAQRFEWTHNPTDGTAQTAYEVRHRLSGDQTWTVTGKVVSGSSFWDAPADTFATDSNYEWQARTWGSDADPSPWSGSVTFSTALDPSVLRENKRAVMLNTDTGDLETAERGALPPVGSLLAFAGGAAPAGWLICDGSVVLQDDYPSLFAVIGSTWNTGGEQANEFRLPDLRDRAAVGASGTKPLGTTGGSDEATLTEANLPPHTHGAGTLATSTDGDHQHGVRRSSGTGNHNSYVAQGNNQSIENQSSVSAGDHAHDVTGDTDSGNGASDPVNVQNPFAALNYIIKT